MCIIDFMVYVIQGGNIMGEIYKNLRHLELSDI